MLSFPHPLLTCESPGFSRLRLLWELPSLRKSLAEAWRGVVERWEGQRSIVTQCPCAPAVITTSSPQCWAQRVTNSTAMHYFVAWDGPALILPRGLSRLPAYLNVGEWVPHRCRICPALLRSPELFPPLKCNRQLFWFLPITPPVGWVARRDPFP